MSGTEKWPSEGFDQISYVTTIQREMPVQNQKTSSMHLYGSGYLWIMLRGHLSSVTDTLKFICKYDVINNVIFLVMTII